MVNHLRCFLVFCFLVLAGMRVQAEEVCYIPIDTEIQYGLTGFVQRALQEAKAKKVKAVVLGIDTFGGRVDATLGLIKAVDSMAPVPVYAFVEDKAWSAGALIALSCERIYMKPGSSIGSAAPVSGGGGKSEALGEKHVSALRAKFRSVAEKNHYSPNLAAAMVDKDMAVREVYVQGQRRFLTPAEIESLANKNQTVRMGDWVIEKGKLLNLSAEQAETYGLSQDTATDLSGLLGKASLHDSNLAKAERNWAEHFAGWVTGSMLSGLLLTLGILALYLEFQSPGFGWPGITGISCLSLVFWGKYMVHLAQWNDILLFVVGIVLILLEIFVIPGFGIAGIGGVVCLLLGLYLAHVPFVVPTAPWDFQVFQDSVLTILVSLTASVVGIVLIIHHMKRIPFLNRLVLSQSLNTVPPTASGDEEKLVGSSGVCLTDLRPVGRARFGRQIMDVVTEGDYVKKGKAVEIFEIRNNRVVVRVFKD